MVAVTNTLTQVLSFSLVSRRLELEHRTLSSLPDVFDWHPVGHNLLILKEFEEPMLVHVYGAVKRAYLCGFRPRDRVFMDIQLWSVQDGEKASRLFAGCDAGE